MYAGENTKRYSYFKRQSGVPYMVTRLPYGPASQFLSIYTRKLKIQMFIFLKILYKSVQSNTLDSSQELGTTQRTSTDGHNIETKEQHITVRWILKVYTYNPSILEAGGA